MLSPKISATRAARLLSATQLADVRQQIEMVASEPSADAIHGLRVALRRLQAALELFDAPADLDDEIKQLASLLGRCRDAQILLAWLSTPGGTRETSSLRARERRQLQRALPLAMAAIVRWRDHRYAAFAQNLQHLELRGRFDGHRLRQRLNELSKRVDRQLSELNSPPTAEQVHRLRIRVKQLRYATELLEAHRPKERRSVLPFLRQLQTDLGSLHDSDVHIDWLVGLIHSTPKAETVRALLARARGERLRATHQVNHTLKHWKKAVGAVRP